MQERQENIPEDSPAAKRRLSPTLARVIKYTGYRAAALLLTVVIGVYLTIVVANMGGQVDKIRIAQIREAVGTRFTTDPRLSTLPASEIRQRIEDQVQLEIKRLGLNRPFILRSFTYLKDALTLSLGRAEILTSDSGSRQVRLILQERLPATLLLFATADIFLFFAGILAALFLSRRYGSFLDRALITVVPLSVAPGWFYGIFLILIFAAFLKILPFGGMVATPPPQSTLNYALSVLQHLILPVIAILFGAAFITIYSWRTFFLMYSSEDYVEMAKAKGLSPRLIERRYILRPTLTTIVTSFSLGIISIWTGSIILEVVFNWPGLGRLLFQAISAFDTPIVVGAVVIYAYLLALTVFLLDVVYAFLDPRVKVGGGTTS